MNLLSETFGKMELYGKTFKDVEQVTWEVITKREWEDVKKDAKPVFNTETHWCTWETFAEAARTIDYNNGYGRQEIEESLEILFKDGSWMQRWEYDGSEGWEYVVPRKHVEGEPVSDQLVVRKALWG